MDEKPESSHKQLELDSLIEFSQLINSNLNLDFILGHILLSLMGKMMITKGILLINKDNDSSHNSFSIVSLKGLDKSNVGKEINCGFPKIPVFRLKDFETENYFFGTNGIEFFFKIYFSNKLLGILCLGNKVTKTALSKREILFIETLLNISASSIENTLKFNQINALNTGLSQKIQQLKSLFEMSKEFNSNFQEKEKIIKLLQYTLLGNFGIKDLIIFSKYKSDNFYVLTTTIKEFKCDYDSEPLEKIEKPYFISASDTDSLLKCLRDKNIQLIIPLGKNSQTESLVCIGKKLTGSAFTETDIEFLQSILNLSIISIENSILFIEFLEKQKIESELKIAREMQVAMLPKEIYQPENYEISAVNIPALHVGGDYYDVVRISDSKYALVIADVSGKGTPASLLMSNLQSAVRSALKLYTDETFDIVKTTSVINELIFENTTPEKFITFFWGILDTADDSFTYVNSGHNPPYLLHNNDFLSLSEGGLMLGIMKEGFPFDSARINFGKDDLLVIYTDGVTEAMNKDTEEFGEERLQAIMKSSLSYSSDIILNTITGGITLFTAGTNQYDDITLIVLKRK